MKKSTSSGFTLIELLTVIAIIGILAAILIPVVGRVRESARFTRGQSNMREWTKANLLFANDNRGILPHDGGANISAANNLRPARLGGVGAWWNELPRYLGQRTIAELNALNALPTFGSSSPFVCPNAEAQPGSVAPAWLCYGPSFAMSNPTGNPPYTTNLREVKDPARTVLFSELTNHSPGTTTAFANANPARLAETNRWRGKSLVGFFDGSVRTFTRQQLTDQGADLQGTGTRSSVIWDLRP